MFLKRILCSHKYKYYHHSVTRKIEFRFHFICKKCKKEFTLTENQIFEDYKFYKIESKKLMACEENCPAPMELLIPTSYYHRKPLIANNEGASLLYHNYLKKGIDLKEIENDDEFKNQIN